MAILIPKNKAARLEFNFKDYHEKLTNRSRSAIIEDIADYYKPYVLRRLSRDSFFDRQEVMQLYLIDILNCLDTFEGRNGATFNTYLYYSIGRIFKRYFTVTKPMLKKSTVYFLESSLIDGVTDLNEYLDNYTM